MWPGLILFEKKSHNGQIHKMPNINVANNKNIELSNKATKYLFFIKNHLISLTDLHFNNIIKANLLNVL